MNYKQITISLVLAILLVGSFAPVMADASSDAIEEQEALSEFAQAFRNFLYELGLLSSVGQERDCAKTATWWTQVPEAEADGGLPFFTRNDLDDLTRSTNYLVNTFDPDWNFVGEWDRLDLSKFYVPRSGYIETYSCPYPKCSSDSDCSDPYGDTCFTTYGSCSYASEPTHSTPVQQCSSSFTWVSAGSVTIEDFKYCSDASDTHYIRQGDTVGGCYTSPPEGWCAEPEPTICADAVEQGKCGTILGCAVDFSPVPNDYQCTYVCCERDAPLELFCGDGICSDQEREQDTCREDCGEPVTPPGDVDTCKDNVVGGINGYCEIWGVQCGFNFVETSSDFDCTSGLENKCCAPTKAQLDCDTDECVVEEVGGLPVIFMECVNGEKINKGKVPGKCGVTIEDAVGWSETQKISLTMEQISKGTTTQLISSACIENRECVEVDNFTVSCISLARLREDGVLTQSSTEGFIARGNTMLNAGLIGGVIGGAIGITSCAIAAASVAALPFTAGFSAPLVISAAGFCGSATLIGAGLGAGIAVTGSKIFMEISDDDPIVAAFNAEDDSAVGICTAEPVGGGFCISSVGDFVGDLTGIDSCQTNTLILIIGGLALVIVFTKI